MNNMAIFCNFHLRVFNAILKKRSRLTIHRRRNKIQIMYNLTEITWPS